MRYTAAEIAIQLVIENLEANHITCDTASISARVYSWYNHSDEVDPEILAACALSGRDWFPGATYDYMLEARERWFPRNPFDEIAAWEIRMF